MGPRPRTVSGGPTFSDDSVVGELSPGGGWRRRPLRALIVAVGVVTWRVRGAARIARLKERLAVTPDGKLLLVDPTRRVVVPMPPCA